MARPTEPKKRRGFLSQLLISLVATAVVVVVTIEILSRIADVRVEQMRREPGFKPEDAGIYGAISKDTLEYGDLKRANEQRGARSEPHPYLGYALKKSFHTAPTDAKQASHNALGFRGKETTWEKPAGVFRIVTTGGSSVYGQSETRDEAVWSQRLEDMLNEAGRGTRFEVVNTGVSGWSTFEMLIHLELRALDLAPDLVIVYEAINDMRCALYNRGGPVQNDNTHWRNPWPVDRPSWLEERLSASRAYLVWRRYLTNYTQERVDLGFYAIRNYDQTTDLYLHAPNPVPEGGFANYRRNLHTILSVCELRGAKPVVVTQALARWHLDSAQSRAEQLAAFDRIQALQKEICAQRGVPLLDAAKVVEAEAARQITEMVEAAAKANPGRSRDELRREFEAIKRSDVYFTHEVHPNDSGSELIARTIADMLLASDLVPK